MRMKIIILILLVTILEATSKNDCQEKATKGEDYTGSVSKTKSGLLCQKWNSQSPHGHGEDEENHNHCRNPNDRASVWCFTTNPNTRWDYCDVPACDSYSTEDGAENEVQDDDINGHNRFFNTRKKPKGKKRPCRKGRKGKKCRPNKRPVKPVLPTVSVLPSNLELSQIDKDHCCQFRTFEESIYEFDGVVLSSTVLEQYGCVDNCAFKNVSKPEQHVCFAQEDSECIDASVDFSIYSQQAEENREKFLTLLAEKTEQYKNLNITNLADKVKFIKQDIRNNELHPCERPPKILLSAYEYSKLPRPDIVLPSPVNQYIDELVDVYNKDFDQDELLNNLDPFEVNLQNNYGNNYHQISHFLIQNTRMVSMITKPEDEGGNNGVNKFWEAVLANTGPDSDGLIRAVKAVKTSCDSSAITDTLTGTAMGCLEGPEGCIAGGITAGVAGVVSCVPNVIEGIGCFGSTSLVETTSGVKKMSELVIGDFIRTSSPSEGFHSHFTEFLGWLDRQMSAPVEMLQVLTSQGRSSLTLTASHVVFTGNETKYAEKLQPGDSLIHWNGTHIAEQEVTEIRKTYETGFWAPLTRDGTLLVNGYLASCYASFSHQISDLAMIPVKAMPTFLLENEESQHKDGVRSVVKMMKKVGKWIGLRKTKQEANKFPFSATDKATNFWQFTAKTEI